MSSKYTVTYIALIRLAVTLKKENSISKIPSLEVMKQNSAYINNKAIPPLQSGVCTLNLPSIENTQLKNNFQIYSEEVLAKSEKKNYKAHNWFLSNKVENVTRIRQKGLSLAKKRVMPSQVKDINENNIENDNDSGSGEVNVAKNIKSVVVDNKSKQNNLMMNLQKNNIQKQSIRNELPLMERREDPDEEDYDF